MNSYDERVKYLLSRTDHKGKDKDDWYHLLQYRKLYPEYIKEYKKKHGEIYMTKIIEDLNSGDIEYRHFRDEELNELVEYMIENGDKYQKYVDKFGNDFIDRYEELLTEKIGNGKIKYEDLSDEGKKRIQNYVYKSYSSVPKPKDYGEAFFNDYMNMLVNNTLNGRINYSTLSDHKKTLIKNHVDKNKKKYEHISEDFLTDTRLPYIKNLINKANKEGYNSLSDEEKDHMQKYISQHKDKFEKIVETLKENITQHLINDPNEIKRDLVFDIVLELSIKDSSIITIDMIKKSCGGWGNRDNPLSDKQIVLIRRFIEHYKPDNPLYESRLRSLFESADFHLESKLLKLDFIKNIIKDNPYLSNLRKDDLDEEKKSYTPIYIAVVILVAAILLQLFLFFATSIVFNIICLYIYHKIKKTQFKIDWFIFMGPFYTPYIFIRYRAAIWEFILSIY